MGYAVNSRTTCILNADSVHSPLNDQLVLCMQLLKAAFSNVMNSLLVVNKTSYNVQFHFPSAVW